MAWHWKPAIGGECVTCPGSTLTNYLKKTNLLGMLYSWRFSHYSALIHWLLHGHMKSNKSNFFRPNNITGENYDVKRETVHYYPQNVDRCCTWSERAVEGGLMLSLESQRVSQNITNYLMTGPLGHSEFCFSRSLNVSLDFFSGNIEILGKQNSLFSSGPVIEC